MGKRSPSGRKSQDTALCYRNISPRPLLAITIVQKECCAVLEDCTVAQYSKVSFSGLCVQPGGSAVQDMCYRVGWVVISPLVLISVNTAYLVTEKLYLS